MAIIGKNNLNETIVLGDMGGFYFQPQGTEVLSDFFGKHQIAHSRDLYTRVEDGDITLNVNGQDMSAPDAMAYLELAMVWDTIDDFTDLLDTPGTYAEQGDLYVKVKPDESGLEFTTVSGILTGGDEPLCSYYVTSYEESSTTSISWREKLKLTFTPDGGDYEVHYSCLVSNAFVAELMKTRLQVDDTDTYHDTRQELWRTNYLDDTWNSRTGSFIVTLDNSDHFIDLDYCTGKNNKTVYIKEATIIVRRLIQCA